MSWDDEAATWDDNTAVRAYSNAAFASLERVLGERDAQLEGANVFDFGCGTGLLTAAMAARAASVVGLDLSAEMIAVLERKELGNVVPIAGQLPDVIGGPQAPLGAFDLVTCSSVCAFLEDYPGTAASLASLLVPGGLFLQWDWVLDPTADEPMGLSREAIESALSSAGLVDVRVDVGFEQPFEGMVMAPWLGVGRRPTS